MLQLYTDPMRLWTIAFLLGTVLINFNTLLPNYDMSWVIGAVAILFVVISHHKRLTLLRLPAAFLLGFAGVSLYANTITAWLLLTDL